jgi:hypothetical protein
MANPTYIEIARHVVPAGGERTISFTSIPQTYRDLHLVMSARFDTSSRTTDTPIVYFNADQSTSTYPNFLMRGNASAASGGNSSGYPGFYGGEINSGQASANAFSNADMYIGDYATNGTNKSAIWNTTNPSNAQSTVYTQVSMGTWTGTSPITTITIYDSYGTSNFVEGSTLTLYGIKNS